jgi:hypothetical protein
MGSDNLRTLFAEFLAAPFPRLGGSVGRFAAYDGDIAGYATRAIEGEAIDASVLPEPDSETKDLVRRLRTSQSRSADEAEFLQYFDLLDRVRQGIAAEPDFRAWRPRPSETTSAAYCARLEAEGHEEIFIRKRLAQHFNMSVDEMGDFFEGFATARLRHIALLSEMHPNRTEYSLVVKVSRNLGISREVAERWIHAFREAKAKPK